MTTALVRSLQIQATATAIVLLTTERPEWSVNNAGDNNGIAMINTRAVITTDVIVIALTMDVILVRNKQVLGVDPCRTPTNVCRDTI